MKTKTLLIMVAASMLTFTNANAQEYQGRISSGSPIQAVDEELQMKRRQSPEEMERARQEQIRIEQERMERKAAKEAKKREKQVAKEQKKAEKAAQKAAQKAAKK